MKPEKTDYESISKSIVEGIKSRCSPRYGVELLQRNGFDNGKYKTSFSIILSRKHRKLDDGTILDIEGLKGTKYGIYNGELCNNKEDAYKSLVYTFIESPTNELNAHTLNELKMKLLLEGLL